MKSMFMPWKTLWPAGQSKERSPLRRVSLELINIKILTNKCIDAWKLHSCYSTMSQIVHVLCQIPRLLFKKIYLLLVLFLLTLTFPSLIFFKISALLAAYASLTWTTLPSLWRGAPRQKPSLASWLRPHPPPPLLATYPFKRPSTPTCVHTLSQVRRYKHAEVFKYTKM